MGPFNPNLKGNWAPQTHSPFFKILNAQVNTYRRNKALREPGPIYGLRIIKIVKNQGLIFT